MVLTMRNYFIIILPKAYASRIIGLAFVTPNAVITSELTPYQKMNQYLNMLSVTGIKM